MQWFNNLFPIVEMSIVTYKSRMIGPEFLNYTRA